MTNAIFQPMCVLALWTGVVIAVTGGCRLWAVWKKRLSSDDFKVGESPDVPEDIRLPNRNLMNLLEMPVLFYVVCLAYYVTGRAYPGVVSLAWVYVGLRLAHSIIHLTYNRVQHRFVAFAASNIVLLVMWVRFALKVF